MSLRDPNRKVWQQESSIGTEVSGSGHRLVRGALAGLLLLATFSQIKRALDWGHGSWQMGDWLIHYGDGFVRRGLPGTIIRWVSEWSGLPANYLVIGLSLTAFFVLAAGLLWLGRSVFSPGLLLSSVVLGFAAYQDSIIRKDCLGLLLFVACLHWADRRGSCLLRWGMVNVFACVSLLVHETFAFFALPALVLLDRHAPFRWRDIGRRCIAVSPAVACFLMTVAFHGSPTHSAAIHESWIPLWQVVEGPDADLSEPAAAIAALGWTASEGMAMVAPIWNRGLYQPLAWAMVFGLSLLLVLAFTRPSGQERSRERLIGLLAFQIVSLSPLFVVGIDYGRWLFLWVASSMILFLWGRRLPGRLEARMSSWVGLPWVTRALNRLSRHEWVLLCFGVPILWSLRNFLTAGPIPHHLWVLLSF